MRARVVVAVVAVVAVAVAVELVARWRVRRYFDRRPLVEAGPLPSRPG
jgi:hypothetical protein